MKLIVIVNKASYFIIAKKNVLALYLEQQKCKYANHIQFILLNIN